MNNAGDSHHLLFAIPLLRTVRDVRIRAASRPIFHRQERFDFIRDMISNGIVLAHLLIDRMTHRRPYNNE